MAEQVGSGMVAGRSPESSRLGPAGASGAAAEETARAAMPHHHGRPVSWVAVSIMMAAFLVGGLGLVLGPTWWLFWAGAAMCAVGGLLALATHIFEDWY